MTHRTGASKVAHARTSLARWLPPALAERARARFGSVRFLGDYGSWSAAAAACSGYADQRVLERVERAARAVHEGRAAFERDGVLFDEVQRAWPVLACLLWIASQRQGRLHVLDFGGSLGSSYRQHQSFLSALEELRWSVIEQPQFVAAGRRGFEDAILRFYPDLPSCMQAGRPNVVLLSSVLPYVEDPYSVLSAVLARDIDFVLIDRTPFLQGERDRLCVQRVSARLGRASYPAWFFSRTKFLRQFEGRYSLVEQFDGDDRANVRCRYQGFLFQRVEGSTDAR
jgi:putative methyltransferase (TIGR04325 family)